MQIMVQQDLLFTLIVPDPFDDIIGRTGFHAYSPQIDGIHSTNPPIVILARHSQRILRTQNNGDDHPEHHRHRPATEMRMKGRNDENPDEGDPDCAKTGDARWVRGRPYLADGVDE